MQTDLSKRKDSTNTLLDGIFKASTLDNFIQEHEDALRVPTLSAYLGALCREKGMASIFAGIPAQHAIGGNIPSNVYAAGTGKS